MIDKMFDLKMHEWFKERIGDMKEALQSKNLKERWNNRVLKSSKVEKYTIVLSLGGPQDLFEFEYDPLRKVLVNIAYHFYDYNSQGYFSEDVLDICPNSEEWKVLEEIFYFRVKTECFKRGIKRGEKMKIFECFDNVSGMSKCRKRPLIIQAKQMNESFRVRSLEGNYACGRAGDYLLRGVEGELYICNSNIFKKTYEWIE